jgi:hypothetical protein
MSITAAAAPGHHSRHWLSCFAIPIFERTGKRWPEQGEKEDFTTNDDLYGPKIMEPASCQDAFNSFVIH